MRKSLQVCLPIVFVCVLAAVASAQGVYQGGGSFHVQCPTATVRHPGGTATGGSGTVVTPHPELAEAPYTGPQVRTATKDPSGAYTFTPALTFTDNGGAIKCQEISGGDGYMTEADGNQTFMFAFGPLSGLGQIRNGLPGTVFANEFNQPYTASPFNNGLPNPLADGTSPSDPVAAGANAAISDPAAIMNTGVMNGSIPGPLMAFDEDDEFFLTLSNVGMLMRPDLFEQHTVHFHGYPNASSFYDGVPDASIAINIGGSFTYYYLAPDAGTYFWHCHITPPEHLQMGMVGQLFVRPRQNRVPSGNSLYQASVLQQSDLRTACNPGLPATSTLPGPDILCSAPLPASNTVAQGTDASGNLYKYVYNDGDGSTRYDIDVPIQIHGFDPNFHFVGMTFNPEGFSDMKDKYFLLNGRSYPDTVGVAGGPADVLGQLAGASNPEPSTHAITTAASDTLSRPSQPLSTLITLSASGGPAGTATCPTAPCGQRAALRIADLDVQEYQTLSSIGIPMQVVGFNAKLLRDQAGNNLYITTNSITLGGGESLDVILDSTGVPPGVYFLYTPQLDHLSNDAENFGGLMTEVVVTP
jgi:FtsP/CotA-like multicopper oxidase with cupredoxin domain